MANILIIDDEPALARVLAEMLEELGHHVARSSSGRDVLVAIDSQPDVIVTDLAMPGLDGMGVLKAVRARSPGSDVIMMTAYATVESAVDAIREGAIDYLIKPFAMHEFRMRVERVLERRELSRRTRTLEAVVDSLEGFGRVVAESEPMRAVVKLARQVAATDETVLLLGETGTGKNLLASAIHRSSPRSAGPLVELHLGALPGALIESELFGYERGAFTGATTTKQGLVESAAGGTLFLDEVGELPASTQVKLLRLLQDRSFMRVGSTDTRCANVRIVAATHRDLDAAVAAGTFRQDLYYRLAVFPIEIPPLRARPADLLATVTALLARKGLGPDRITRAALDTLTTHAWPGNVRELENALARALVLAGSEPIAPVHLPTLRADPAVEHALEDLLVPGFSLDTCERMLIHAALARAADNKTEAARILGITRRRLYSRLESIATGKLKPDADED